MSKATGLSGRFTPHFSYAKYVREEDLINKIFREGFLSTEGHRATDGVVSNYMEAVERISDKLQNYDPRTFDLILNDYYTRARSDNNITATSSQNGMIVSPQNKYTPISQELGFKFHEEDGWQCASARQPAAFSTRGQKVRGSTHGKGGRLPGSGAQVRRYYAKYARVVLRKRMYDLFTTTEDKLPGNEELTVNGDFPEITKESTAVCEKILEELASRDDIPNLDIQNLTCENLKEKFREEFHNSEKDEHPPTVEHIPLCILGITARFSKSDSMQPGMGRIFNVRERHIVNTWLDRKGHVRCTCIGSTQYEIFALNEEFHSPCCVHADAFAVTLREICEWVFGNPYIPFQILYNAFALVEPEMVDSDNKKLPQFRSAHEVTTVIFICNDVYGASQLCWVLIRRVMRSGGRYLCAFCDLINTNQCHHVTKLLSLCIEKPVAQFNIPLGDVDLFEEENKKLHSRNHCNEREEKFLSKNHQPVSYLPVIPVNCPVDLRVDQEICELVRRNGVFRLKAPALCIYCQSPPLEHTRSVNTSGLVMCSVGTCSMEVDTFICSVCKKQFSAEGRVEGVFVDSICLAATHKLLRDQLIGFALGNGTLTSRLSHFHSQVTAFEDANLFPNQRPCKSSRKLYNLCIYFVRMMVSDSHVSLFFCTTCQGGPCPPKGKNEASKVPRAICVDGIWAGYLKKSAIPFKNVSEACKPIQSFSCSVKSTFHKPRTGFFRLEKTVTFLLEAIKGHGIEANCGSINAIAAETRMVYDTILPVDFYNSSVCGTFPRDYKYDIGEFCLKKFRELTCTLFHKQTLIYSLLEPIQKLFQRNGKRQKTGKQSSNKRQYSRDYKVVTMCITRVTNLLQDDEAVCWNEKIKPSK